MRKFTTRVHFFYLTRMRLNIKFKFYSRLASWVHRQKVWYYKQAVKGMHESVNIYGSIFVYYPDNICVGENVSLNEGVVLEARGGIRIADQCTLSAAVQLQTGSLDLCFPYSVRRQV